MDTKPIRVSKSWESVLGKIKSIGIDAMCFIYQFEGHPLFGPLTFKLFTYLEEGKIKGITSVITIAEILSSPKLQKDHLSWEQEKHRFYQTPNLTVVPVEGKICEAAALLRGKYGITLPDAIQIITAIFQRADVFITNDAKLKKVKEIPILILQDFLRK